MFITALSKIINYGNNPYLTTDEWVWWRYTSEYYTAVLKDKTHAIYFDVDETCIILNKVSQEDRYDRIIFLLGGNVRYLVKEQ